MDGQLHDKELVGAGIGMVEDYGKDYLCVDVHEERQ